MNYVDISPSAVLGEQCKIGNFVTIGENCILGEGVVLHNNVTLYPGVEIGDHTEIFDGAVIGRPPKSAGNTVHKLAKTFKPTVLGKNCVVGSNAVLYAQSVFGNNILIGDGAVVREGAVIEDFALIAMNCTFNHNVTLKSRSKVMDLSHITADTVIDEDVFVGVNVVSANDNGMRLKGQEVGAVNHIHIKTGSRIGSAVMLLPGVTIGEQSLVGACSMVRRDVADGKTVMGIPAKEK